VTTVELLKAQIDASGGQLTRALNGVDPSHKDFRLHAGGYSFAEQVAHLSEAYTAVLAAAEGKEHEWGSFKPASEEWTALVSEALSLREKAAATVLEDDDTKLMMGADYIVSHDLYHVGQLATMRLQVYPDWNCYELYG
jgi:hypothetical protein